MPLSQIRLFPERNIKTLMTEDNVFFKEKDFNEALKKCKKGNVLFFDEGVPSRLPSSIMENLAAEGEIRISRQGVR